MSGKILSRRPSAGTIVAIIALVLALAGTAIAGGGLVTKTKFKKFKQSTNTQLAQTVKGPVTYVTTTKAINTTIQNPVAANCPSGFTVVGGGIKLADPATQSVSDTYPTASGWAGRVGGATTGAATTTAICAKSTAITGAPPTS
jgi:hypothetical protein